MISEYDAGALPATVKALIDATGVGSFDELYALALEFPSLADDKAINLRDLSHLAGMRASSLTVQSVAATSSATRLRLFAMGAGLSPSTAVGLGYTAPDAAPQRVRRRAFGTAIQHVSSRPIIDQGERGTCVAHAMVASAEFAYPSVTLSAQYAYWSAKRHGADPRPHREGTWLKCANQGMGVVGLCEERYWPYASYTIPNDQAHELGGIAPSLRALNNGASRQRCAAFCDDVAHATHGKAGLVLQHLKVGPVVVSLPVFREVKTGANNWHWFGATNYGHVLDPVCNSVLVGCHAVCLFCYIPSSAAKGGGWFVFKNSWGINDWSNGGGSAPASDPQLQNGYGYFSAEFVDTYLQELMRV